MGVESKFCILPDTSGYRPDSRTVRELIEALRSEKFLCDPQSSTFAPAAHRWSSFGSSPDYEGFLWKIATGKLTGSLRTVEEFVASHADSDVLIEWPNSDLNLSGLRYPLSLVPGPEGVYYEIEIHLSSDTVYHTSGIIDPFEEVRCPCGAIVEEVEPSDNDPFYSSRLPNHCPTCGMLMDYAAMPLTLRDGWTGVESRSFGGATYRFALVIDCGKYWPEREAVVIPEFLALVERTMGIKTRVLRDFY